MDSDPYPLRFTRESDLADAVDRGLRSHGGRLTGDEIGRLRQNGLVAHEPWDEADVEELVNAVREYRGLAASGQPPPLAAFRTRLENESVRALRESERLVTDKTIAEVVRRTRQTVFGSADPPFRTPEEAGTWLRAGYGQPGTQLPPREAQMLRYQVEGAANQIAEQLGCSADGPFGSLLYVLCGLTPVVPPISIETRSGRWLPTRFTITVNYPWVSARTVRTAYQIALAAAGDPSRQRRTRLPAPEISSLLALVADTPDLTWPARWREWRVRHPEWVNRYRDHASMRASYAGAKRAWLPSV